MSEHKETETGDDRTGGCDPDTPCEETRRDIDIGPIGAKSGAWLAMIVAGLLVGLYGAARLLLEGTVVLGIDSQLPWGILISAYVFFVLVSTGICIGVTSIYSVFGVEKYEPLVKRGVFISIITLMAGGAVIMVSLGQPLRALPMLMLSPNPSSPMWWMIGLYGIYGAALFAEYLLIEFELHVPSGVPVAVGTIALVAAIAAHSTLGAIFGFAETRPYYGGIFGPVYFIVSAILSGIATISLVTIVDHWAKGKEMGPELEELVTGYLGKSLGIVLGVTLFFAVWKILSGVTATSSATALAYEHMLFGPHAWWVWGVAILVGMVAPFVLMVTPATRTVRGVLAASVMVLIGLFASRLEYVIGGQVVALVNDPSYQYPFVSYAPTGTELAVVVLGFAVAALLYTLGDWVFDLDDVSHAAEEPPVTPDPADAAAGGDADD